MNATDFTPIYRRPSLYGQQPQLSPSDEESLLTRVGRGALGGLETVGNILDIPGSMARDVIGGFATGDWSKHNPLDQLLSPFSSENRTTGRDLNRTLGLADQEDTTANWWGGLGTEILTDPLLWVTPFGLTKAGKVAESAGKLTKGLGNAVRAGERAGAVFHLPFGSTPLAELGTGALGAAAGDMLGKGIDAVKYSAPVRYLRSQLSAPLRGTTTRAVQQMAEELAPAIERSRAGGRELIGSSAQELSEAGLKGVGTTQAIRAEQDAIRRAFEGVAPYAGDVSVPSRAIDPIVAENARSIAARKRLGFLVDEYSDTVTQAGRGRYFQRHASGELADAGQFSPLTGGQRGREFTVKTAEDQARRWYLRDIEGMTTKIKDVVSDQSWEPIIQAVREGRLTRERGQEMLKIFIGTKYGNDIPEIATRVTKAGKTQQANRWNKLAQKIIDMPDDVRKAGLFAEHPLTDAGIGIMHARDTEQVGEGILNFLAKDANTWSTANPAEGVPVKEVMRQLGFDTKSSSAAWGQIAQRGGNVAPDMLIKKDIAQDLVKFKDNFTNPRAVNEILRAVDKMTNLTKGMYTGVWPAFHVRNAISGFFQNILTGTMDPLEAVPRSVEAYNLIRGKTVTGAAEIPAVLQRLQQQGRALTDAEGTKVLREMIYAHELAGKYEHAAADVVGKIGGKAPGTIQDITQAIPGVNPLDWSQTGKKLIGATPDTSATKFWRQRGVIEEGTKKFGVSAAGEDLGYVIESVNRIAPFLSQLRKGVDDTVAAMKIGASQAKYGNRHFTPFETNVMQRMFPFYKFSSQMMPWFVKTLVQEPGGRLAQTIRAVGNARKPGDVVPDYVAETTSIPVSVGPLAAIFGNPPEGTDRYISGLGLMHEDPLGFFGSGIRGAGLETISRMNPMLKFPLEWSFGESTFQKGPMGGRELQDMDPLMGRIAANVNELATGKKTKVAPKIGGAFTEALVANSPLSRALSSVRVLTDPRKGFGAKAGVLGSGLRIADVSEGAKESKIRELMQPLMSEMGAKSFERIYFPKDVLESMTPQQRSAAEEYNLYMTTLSKRQKERVAKQKQEAAKA